MQAEEDEALLSLAHELFTNDEIEEIRESVQEQRMRNALISKLQDLFVRQLLD